MVQDLSKQPFPEIPRTQSDEVHGWAGYVNKGGADAANQVLDQALKMPAEAVNVADLGRPAEPASLSERMQDLSGMTGGWSKGLNAGESSAAGNTLSRDTDNTAMTAPGSAPVDPLGPEGNLDTPDLDVGPVTPPTTTVGLGGEKSVQHKTDGPWHTLASTSEKE